MYLTNTFQFAVTDSQRDLVANYSRSERDKGEKRVNLNLYGNKFYNASKEKSNNSGTSSGKQSRQQGEGS